MKTVKSIDAFETIVTDNEFVVCIFSSDVCPDCDYLNTFISDIEKKYAHATFCIIKRDQLPEVFMHYNIFGVPSLYVYQNGEIIATYVDKLRKTYQQIDQFLAKTLSATKEG